MKKNIIYLLLIIVLIHSKAMSSVKEVSVSPQLCILIPTSKALKSYYNKNCIFFYGGEVILLLDRLEIGSYLKIQRYSFKVHDQLLQSDYEKISATWCTLGIVKSISVQRFYFLAKLGLTYHLDKLSFSESEDKSRIGFQPGLVIKSNISKKIKFFIEISYEYESMSVPMYMTYQYSRHQRYLAGKKFQTGGILIQSGISFSVYDLKK